MSAQDAAKVAAGLDEIEALVLVSMHKDFVRRYELERTRDD